jgi:hypothetical protein
VGLLHQIGTESLLSVYTKEAKPKKLTEKEVFEAADRFLAPEYVAQVRSMYALEIDHLKSVPNCSEKERARRHVDVEIRTVDEWRRLLPDSYHEALAFKMMGVKVDLEVELTSSLQQPIDPDEYRNLNEYSAWLETIRGKSETVFDVISQGRMARRFAIPGNFPERLRTSSYERRLDWRAGANSAAIVLPLDPTPTVSVAKHPWGFFRITIPTWRQ